MKPSCLTEYNQERKVVPRLLNNEILVGNEKSRPELDIQVNIVLHIYRIIYMSDSEKILKVHFVVSMCLERILGLTNKYI